MMPIDLFLIRHGQSEGNAAIHLAKHGDDSAYTEKFLRRHSSKWRLTDRGIMQARETGEWLRLNTNTMFDHYYVSDYLRAKETAAELGFPNARWQIDFLLNEREYGEIDPDSGAYKKDSFHKTNESKTEFYLRIGHIIQKLHRECEGERVIIVSHGEVMWEFRRQLEQMSPERLEELKSSLNPLNWIKNGQILHYTRRNPQRYGIVPHFNWMRSICPNKLEWSRPEWVEIVRQTFTNGELLTNVARYPRICNLKY